MPEYVKKCWDYNSNLHFYCNATELSNNICDCPTISGIIEGLLILTQEYWKNNTTNDEFINIAYI